MIGKILNALRPNNLESITGMDATFLYAETPTSPMHVGSVAVLEKGLTYAMFKKRIASRLHQMPKLRKRLVYVPMSIDYPYWADDPNFDIDMHMQHIALPKPGSWAELRDTAARIFSEPLDQSRPLWSFTFVEGLDNLSQVPKGSVAIISKVHHVAIDGVAGAGLLSLIFDMTPNPQPVPEPEPYNPEPLPNELSLILNSAKTFTENPLKFPKLLTQTLSSSFKAGMLTRVQHSELPTAPFSAPPSPLNGIISPRRKWNTTVLELARVKKLKTVMGTTLNDVVLAICAGALRQYLLEKDKLPNKPMVAMVPISTRDVPKDGASSGNQISSMLVQLATNVEDPIERLEVIHENTMRGKTYQGAVGAKTLQNMAEIVPFGIANQAARLYSRFQLAEMHNPVFNLTITNVPGPQFPIYLDGYKMLHIMGMAPIIDGMGLIITVLSYDGKISISPTSDVKSMPDLDNFSRYILESANELEALILKKEKALVKKKKKIVKKSHAESDVLFEQIKDYLKNNKTAMPKDSGIYLFHITGDVDTHWKVDLNKSPGSVRKSKASNPDVTFTIQDDHLMKIVSGDLDLQTAFVQGRLKVTGDMAKAMKFGELLKGVQ
jgi:WS/DGAT/MGAT family acyltransferase